MSCLPELDEFRRDPDKTVYFSFYPAPQWAENGREKIFVYLKAQLEQRNTASIIEGPGAGLMVPWKAGQKSIDSLLDELLLDPAWVQAARLIASRNLTIGEVHPLSYIGDRLEALLVLSGK